METRGCTTGPVSSVPPSNSAARIASLPMAFERRTRLVAFLGWATALSALLVTSLVVASASQVEDLSIAGHLPLAWTALAVLLAVVLVGVFTTSVRVELSARFPWVVAALSIVVSLGAWAVLASGSAALAATIYRGLRIPQGIVQFWDMSLVMESVDCARWGFDVYQANNGCLVDPSIYAPGMVWVRFVPFSLFSQDNAPALGVGLIIAASLALGWLARQSSGLGQIVLAIAAVGAPWVLLLERANIDAVILVVLVVGVAMTRRWSNSLTVWFVAGALYWLMGTWKYYPFVMGLALLPALRIRRGWTVVVSYGVASIGFVLITWQNFVFSSSTNAGMVDFGDWAVLGRIPLVARMLQAQPGAQGLQAMDVPVIVMTLLAVAWGIAAGRWMSARRANMAALAVSGAALYLSSVFISGFGYGYKAAFLLAGVPAVSMMVARGSTVRVRVLVGSAVAALVLLAVQSVIMWNTVLATQSGLVAAGFMLGAGGTILARYVKPALSRQALET